MYESTNYAPLQERIYNFITNSQPSLDRKDICHWAIKGINDTVDLKGLIPTLLLFCVISSLPKTNKSLLTERDRMAAPSLARVKTGTATAELKMSQALWFKLPSAEKVLLSSGNNEKKL